MLFTIYLYVLYIRSHPYMQHAQKQNTKTNYHTLILTTCSADVRVQINPRSLCDVCTVRFACVFGFRVGTVLQRHRTDAWV